MLHKPPLRVFSGHGREMMDRERPIAVNLFCGAGGMSLGFAQAGFDIVAAVDSDPIHVEIYSHNFPGCQTLRADLSLLRGDQLRTQAGLGQDRIDVLFGGPPCGGFSLMGKRRPKDPRNQLLLHFARLVDELGPRYFVVENVQGLLMDPITEVLEAFLQRIDQGGYSVVAPIQTLDSSDFGVPQRRRRIFILGGERGFPIPEYPISPFSDGGEATQPRATVWDAIGDLPNVDEFEELLKSDVYRGELEPAASRYAKILRSELRDAEDRLPDQKKNPDGLSGCLRTVHTPETVRRFTATDPGTFEPVSRFYRLTKNGLCPTLRAGSDQSRGSFTAPRPIHPVHPRCITVREGARLHSFPDWFRFHPTKWHGFREVGNSVPPLLARAVAKGIRNALTAQAER